MDTYRIIGLMSGTSLDGLDVAYCIFNYANKKWSFRIEQAATLPYSAVWQKKLKNAQLLSSADLLQLHNEYGNFLGTLTAKFIKNRKIKKVDFVASHGHTVFHQPQKQLTFQLGHGACIAAHSGLPVVCDFRSLDVACGGQGAPLVPLGDKLLFSQYNFCLNLGGFANVSYINAGSSVAFDICPANIILNYLAGLLNKKFDKSGTTASKGIVNKTVLKKLNALRYYKAMPPKSLGREWLEEEFMPIITTWHDRAANKLATVTEHIAMQIADMLSGKKGTMLVTGGGAHNTYLVKRIKKLATNTHIIIPEKVLVDYKEALIFALLGILRLRKESNCLTSVTGALSNTSGGAIYLPPRP